MQLVTFVWNKNVQNDHRFSSAQLFGPFQQKIGDLMPDVTVRLPPTRIGDDVLESRQSRFFEISFRSRFQVFLKRLKRFVVKFEVCVNHRFRIVLLDRVKKSVGHYFLEKVLVSSFKFEFVVILVLNRSCVHVTSFKPICVFFCIYTIWSIFQL